MLTLVADYISLLPIAIYTGLLYSFCINPINNYLDIILFIFILLADISVKFFKSLPYPDYLYDITRRPKGAYNCDYFSRKGTVKYGTPGFPSGHLTTVTFFAIYIILYRYHKKNTDIIDFIKNNKTFILTNLLLIIATGWARYHKKCHNLFQIIGGILLGSLYAYIFYYLTFRFLKLDDKLVSNMLE